LVQVGFGRTKTIHRWLEVDPKGGGFKRGGENPLGRDLLVVDELRSGWRRCALAFCLDPLKRE
jgi:hypothetical protein